MSGTDEVEGVNLHTATDERDGPEASVQNPGPIPVDFYDSDVDSAIAMSANGSYSTSLASSIRNYTYEHGRRYHAFREGQYPLPNDDKEQDRLDLLHHIFRLVLGGPLYRAPIAEPPPARILDVGTGTGIWAIEIAEEFPSAIVIGTDLSPIQPGWVPPNCKFYIDDAESEWGYRPDEHFDYIHGRGLCGGIGDWANFYGQVYQNLKPGGWLEMQEYEAWVTSDDDTIESAPWTKEWCEQVDVASRMFGKRLNVAHMHKQWLEEAGFVNVREEVHKVPIGPWPRDKKLKEIGRYERAQMLDVVEPFTLALYTRVLGRSLEETNVLMEGVKRELCDPKLHLYNGHHFIWGRKPEN